MALNGICGKAPYCALALFIFAFALPAANAAKEDFQGWQCAWIVLGSLFEGGPLLELPMVLWWNVANLGTLVGWWFWRAGNIGRATVSLALATVSAAWWPFDSELGPENLRVGYWCWLLGIALLALLAFQARAASRRSRK